MHGIIVTSPSPSPKRRGNNLTIQQFSSRAFTLIELLIVIAVLGIVSAGILTAINVAGNLNKANLAKAKTFSASLENDLSINQVGKWSFEETASPFKDTSGYNNNGSCSGASCPTWKNATDCGLGFGGCLNFDGDDYVNVGTIDYTSFNAFTLSAWINPSSIGTRQIFLSSEARPLQFQIWSTSNTKLSMEMLIDGAYSALHSTTTPVLKQNTWYHVVFTHILSTGAWAFYVDGIKYDTGTKTGNSYDGGFATTIGVNPGFAVFFNGLIDEVAIYNQALTAYQIQNLYAKGFLKHYMAQVYSFNY